MDCVTVDCDTVTHIRQGYFMATVPRKNHQWHYIYKLLSWNRTFVLRMKFRWKMLLTIRQYLGYGLVPNRRQVAIWALMTKFCDTYIYHQIWGGCKILHTTPKNTSLYTYHFIFGHTYFHIPLQWRHSGRDGVSNHQPHHCFLNRLFGRRSKKTSKLRVTGLCARNSPVNSPHK